MGHWRSLAVLIYASDTLASIEKTTSLFGSTKFRLSGGRVDSERILDEFKELVKTDGNGEDEDGELSPKKQ